MSCGEPERKDVGQVLAATSKENTGRHIVGIGAKATTIAMDLPLTNTAFAGPVGSWKLRFLRGSVLSLVVLGVFAIIWVSPWLRIGMTRADFNLETTVGFLLVGAFSVTAIAVVAGWAPLLSEEPRSELLRVLLGERLWVRGRGRFLNRLGYQCDRARRDRGLTFSIALVEVGDLRRGTPSGESVVATALATLRQVIRSRDVLGDSGTAEIWVLLVGAHSEGRVRACGRIDDRLRKRLTEVLGSGAPRLAIGGSTFGADGRDAETLLGAARARAFGAGLDTRAPEDSAQEGS